MTSKGLLCYANSGQHFKVEKPLSGLKRFVLSFVFAITSAALMGHGAFADTGSSPTEERSGAAESVSAGDVTWCVPGCRLDNDRVGDPIVPDWCSHWMPESPLCRSYNENGQEAEYCRGYWAGLDRTVLTGNWPGISLVRKRAKVLSAIKRSRMGLKSAAFVCVGIKSKMLASEADKVEKCSPGCEFSAGTSDFESLFHRKPGWCTEVYSGGLRCRDLPCSNIEESQPGLPPTNLCTEFMLLDQEME